MIGLAVAGWIAVGIKLFHLRARPGCRSTRWICAALLTLSASICLQDQTVHEVIDGHTALNTAGTLSNCLTLMAATSGHCAFLHMIYPAEQARRSTRLRLRLLTGVLALIGVLHATTPSNYAEALASQKLAVQIPVISAAAYVYVACLTSTVIEVARATHYRASAAREFSLRNGLRLLLLGLAGTIAYAGLRFAAMSAHLLGWLVPWLYGNLIGVVFRLAILFVITGILLPVTGPRLGLDHLARWWSLDRSYRRLFPLWKLLYDEFPAIALDPPRTRHVGLRKHLGLGKHVGSRRHVDFREPEQALYRRIVEIWDGRLLLLPYFDPRIAETRRAQATGLSDDARSIAVEAGLIASALRRSRLGVPPDARGPAIPDNSPADPDAELDWLIRLAAAVRAESRSEPAGPEQRPNPLTPPSRGLLPSRRRAL
ncbi:MULTISPECIES: MAB_1171c family putative transporter [unclassified Nonomuraea]|uniref:MAB_1171c family putative transporter n=1 Tax=unclassified Nonomuraea TaxID=2593643 RepID=UPI0033E9510F